jgi:membrane protease YdiL (CAAX protease family)
MTRTRAVFLLSVLLATWCAPLAALAEDEPSAEAPAPAAEEKADPVLAPIPPTAPATPSLEERILAEPSALIVTLLLRLVPMGIGCAVLVWAYLRRQEIRAGYRPPPPPVAPAVPFTLGEGIGLFALVLLGIVALTAALASVSDMHPVTLGLVVFAVVGVPLSVVVALRRRRTSPTPPPGFLRAAAVGLAGLCVAMVFLVPVAIVQYFVLEALDVPSSPQETARKVMDSELHLAVQLALYGVLIAPLAEESMFRGVLYPAMRSVLGGTRRAVVLSAGTTSLLFAAMHADAQAFAALFVLSLALTWVVEHTNSLAAAVVLHAAFNASSMLILLVLRG